MDISRECPTDFLLQKTPEIRHITGFSSVSIQKVWDI